MRDKHYKKKKKGKKEKRVHSKSTLERQTKKHSWFCKYLYY